MRKVIAGFFIAVGLALAIYLSMYTVITGVPAGIIGAGVSSIGIIILN